LHRPLKANSYPFSAINACIAVKHPARGFAFRAIFYAAV
jgi:hypothetical protein